MDSNHIFSYISEEFIEKFSHQDEKFNIFIATGFVKNNKFDKAIQQLELGILSNNQAYVSYLMLIALSINTGEIGKLDNYINALNKSQLPKEVLVTLEHILSNTTPSQAGNIKQDTKFEKLINGICSTDVHFNGWISFKSDNSIESKFYLNENIFNFIDSIHANVVNNETTPFYSVLGTIERVTYEFEFSKIYYTIFDNKHLYLVGDENFSTNYILLKLKE